VAVVVPSQAYIKELVGSTENASEKINERSIREQILANINNLAKQAGLMVKPFAQQGIVSTTMKLQRHEGKKFYKKQIDAMYE
jgi:long-subunit acyl-CoA synthetase (AMP-forming)